MKKTSKNGRASKAPRKKEKVADRSRFTTYHKEPRIREKRTIEVHGVNEDAGKFFKCWNCGFINNKDVNKLSDAYAGIYPANDNVVLDLQFAGANGATTILDSSPTKKTMTANGGASISTLYSWKGFNSIILDGTDDYVSTPTHADFDFSGGKFSIDAWVMPTAYPSSTQDTIVGHATNAGSYYGFGINPSGYLYFDMFDFEDVSSQPTIVPLNQWSHVELDEEGDDYYLFVNGNWAGHVSSTDRLSSSYTNNLTIGASFIGTNATRFIAGYISRVRMSNVTRHTESFHPDPSEYTFPSVSAGCAFCRSPNYR